MSLPGAMAISILPGGLGADPDRHRPKGGYELMDCADAAGDLDKTAPEIFLFLVLKEHMMSESLRTVCILSHLLERRAIDFYSKYQVKLFFFSR